MIRVQILINFTPIADYRAVRVKGGTHPDDVNTYQLEDGRRFKHRYGDGAIVLSQKILRRVKELK
jgi:hypothetical protein